LIFFNRSVRELQKGLSTASEYVSIMERAQEYAECVAESRMAAARSGSGGAAEHEHEHEEHIKKDKSKQLIAMMVCLFISSWESLGRYQAAVYKQAYKNVRRIAESDRGVMFSGSGAESERALSLQHQVNMAEQCCASQKGLILAEEWGEHVLAGAATATATPLPATTTPLPATTTPPPPATAIESAIEIDAASSIG
jgi:hypothetical protein